MISIIIAIATASVIALVFTRMVWKNLEGLQRLGIPGVCLVIVGFLIMLFRGAVLSDVNTQFRIPVETALAEWCNCKHTEAHCLALKSQGCNPGNNLCEKKKADFENAAKIYRQNKVVLREQLGGPDDHVDFSTPTCPSSP